jgi:hypothetical protein
VAKEVKNRRQNVMAFHGTILEKEKVMPCRLRVVKTKKPYLVAGAHNTE